MGPTSILHSSGSGVCRAVQAATDGAAHNPQQELQKIEGFKAGKVSFNEA
jgi:hypothetical protein